MPSSDGPGAPRAEEAAAPLAELLDARTPPEAFEPALSAAEPGLATVVAGTALPSAIRGNLDPQKYGATREPSATCGDRQFEANAARFRRCLLHSRCS